LIFPNPDQPRRTFDEDKLSELTESIRSKGIFQPLIVRQRPDNNQQYEIVAGERRWRAAQRANLHQVPVIVREFNDTEVLEIAIIENIQRADLNPVEEAAGYRQLMDRFGHTQEKLAEALGKSRSHIANLLRLLNLPTDVQGYLVSGQLSTGHARALITSDHPSELAKKIIAGNLSVRETERLVKQAAQGTDEGKKAKTPGSKHKLEKDADTKALEGDLSAALGMRVSVEHKMGTEAGSITITYKTLDQLDDLCGLLSATSLDGSK
jgi:ParB family chromosome partitioning protein